MSGKRYLLDTNAIVCLLRGGNALQQRLESAEQVARTAAFAVRVFPVAIIATMPHSIAVSKLRRPFLSDRYFLIVVRLLRSARTNLIAPSRGRKDADHKSGGPRYPLAGLYGVSTKRLNEQVKRNRHRFPLDFMFQLSGEETDSLRSQLATSSTGQSMLPVTRAYGISGSSA